jgi:O-acetyl-ADP-ribose deacetylase
VTGAGKLPAKFVIHAVGPRMGEGDEDSKLRSAVLCSLQIASEKGLKSVSMPAISSGIFGFPKDRCAMILIRESVAYLKENPDSTLELIEFCIYDDITLGFFQNELSKIR